MVCIRYHIFHNNVVNKYKLNPFVNYFLHNNQMQPEKRNVKKYNINNINFKYCKTNIILMY